MIRSRTRRVREYVATFDWSGLILDRSRKLVGLQSPATCATRAGGDSDPNFENYAPSTPCPRTPDAVFTPVHVERTGMSTSGLSFLGSVRGCTCLLYY